MTYKFDAVLANLYRGTLLFFLCLPSASYSQNFEDFGKKDFLKLSGSLSSSQVMYVSSGSGRRDPYNFFVSANLNADIYGWSVPLGFTFSNQSKGSFQQPFNQYNLNPVYKWVTAHVGYTSSSFSSYTLSGHSFLGIGADLAPSGPFKISLMYGRLQKAVVRDTSVNAQIEPNYKRMGYGFKATYSKNKNHVDLIVFRAQDQISSNPVLNIATVTPQENLVTGINSSKTLFKKLMLSGEFALSGLTKDIRASKDSLQNSAFPGFLLNSNSSTTFYTAYKLGLGYNAKKYSIGLGYERVSPEYKTLGAYFFANDFENVTGNFKTKFLHDKIDLAASGGLQHDDLRKEKQSATKRFVSSLNLSSQVTNKIMLSGSYSNFQSFVNIRSSFNQLQALTPFDNLDTLNFTQLSQNVSLNSNYAISNDKEKSQSVNMALSYMVSADKQGSIKQNSGARFYNFNTAYTINFVPKNLSLTASINASQSIAEPTKTLTIGPVLGINKAFFDKKLRSSFSTSWNNSYSGGIAGGGILNFRLGNSYVVKKKHNLNLSMVALKRQQANEFTSTLGYNYSF